MNEKINIIDGERKHITDCTEILQNSELGKAYFSDTQKAMNMLEYALENKELYVALNEKDECVGYIYCMPKGVFGSYPYLHIISVKEDCRGNGIGSLLISFFEEKYPSDKYFLTVDDFNVKAKNCMKDLVINVWDCCLIFIKRVLIVI